MCCASATKKQLLDAMTVSEHQIALRFRLWIPLGLVGLQLVGLLLLILNTSPGYVGGWEMMLLFYSYPFAMILLSLLVLLLVRKFSTSVLWQTAVKRLFLFALISWSALFLLLMVLMQFSRY